MVFLPKFYWNRQSALYPLPKGRGLTARDDKIRKFEDSMEQNGLLKRIVDYGHSAELWILASIAYVAVFIACSTVIDVTVKYQMEGNVILGGMSCGSFAASWRFLRSSKKIISNALF